MMNEPKPLFRQMTIGNIRDEALDIYGRQIALFFLMAAIVQIPVAMLLNTLAPEPSAGNMGGSSILSLLRGNTPTSQPPTPEPISREVLTKDLIIFLIGFATALLSQAALVQAASDSYQNRQPSFLYSYAVAFLRLTKLLLATLFTVLVLVLISMTIIGVPIAIYLGVRWLVAPQVIVLESTGPWRGLVRSYRLAQGNWWRCFTVVALVLLAIVGASIVVNVPLGLLTSNLEAATPSIKEQLSLIGILINAALTSLIGPAAAIVFTLLYIDLRAREEAKGASPSNPTTSF